MPTPQIISRYAMTHSTLVPTHRISRLLSAIRTSSLIARHAIRLAWIKMRQPTDPGCGALRILDTDLGRGVIGGTSSTSVKTVTTSADTGLSQTDHLRQEPKAWLDGYVAGAKDQRSYCCPYPPLSTEHWAWCSGVIEGQAARHAKCAPDILSRRSGIDDDLERQSGAGTIAGIGPRDSSIH